MSDKSAPLSAFLLSLLLYLPLAKSDGLLLPFYGNQPITVCEYTEAQTQPPSFTESNCQAQALVELDPQNRALWISIKFEQPERWQELKPPYGLYFFGKASSVVYLNDMLLGENGTPSFNEGEIPGKMDSVFFVPANLLRESDNELVINMSSQHSWLNLSQPIHGLAFGQFGDTKQYVQRNSTYGVALLGAFAVGFFYFLVLSIGKQGGREHALFAALSLLAGLQLATELSRGFVQYDYVWQDIRLMLVTLFSFIFGITVLTYSSIKVAGGAAIHWVYAGVILTLLAIIFAPGFDGKTTAGIFIPLLVSLTQLFLAWYKRKKQKLLHWFIVQLILAITIIVVAESFHEIVHFMVIGILLIYLFINQAKEQMIQEAQFRLDQRHIAKLELALSQKAQSETSSKLELSMAGKTEFIETRDIAYCKASGDYVELHLNDEREKLYSGTLKQLEDTLPPVFLRVHRSYLVNLNDVSSLQSKQGDDGKSSVLVLNMGQEVPVSRRLLPTVRESIKNTAM